nr:hypothetical protein [uncultured Rhodopila sp.]
MKNFTIATALVSAGLLTMPVAFAQQTPKDTVSQKDELGATKQKTQADPTGQYNFPTPGGQYSSRPVSKPRTEGQAMTGNTNGVGGSK